MIRDSRGKFAKRNWWKKNWTLVVFLACLLVPLGIGETMQWYHGGIAPVVYTAEAHEIEVEEKVVLIGTEYTVPEYTDLQNIADCESGVRNADGTAVRWSAKQRNDDGSVVIGNAGTLVGEDIGKWQINTYFHLERARSLGIDLYSESGNERYAKILFHQVGGAPWSASRDCHGVL